MSPESTPTGVSRVRRPRKLSYGAPADGWQRIRIRFVSLLFIAVFVAVVLRLYQLQLAPSENLVREDERHFGVVPIEVPRGNIYDRNRRLLANDSMATSIYARPQVVDDAATLARELAPVLSVDAEVLESRLTRLSQRGTLMHEVALLRYASEEVTSHFAGNLEEWETRGLFFKLEPVRAYPQDDLAAHVLGFVNRERVGSGGIELAYDHFLASTPGQRRARRDGGRTLISSLTEEYREPEGGAHVHLSIDAAMQYRLENALDQVLIDANARASMGLLMDPHTGAILAMASRPAFDPNRFDDYPMDFLKNPAISDVFEPGSVFKIVTAAAGLENGLVNWDTMIDCENGLMRIGRRQVRDYHKMGVVPFSQAFQDSSNIAFIKIADMLGPERLDDWIRRFGFGQRTSREFPGESAGIYMPRSRWSGYSMGSLPMGQEVSVTMPQLARAFSAIANGGYLVEPYLVERIVERDGTVVRPREQTPPRLIMSPETAKTLGELCHLVVREGTGRRARIDEFRVAGKTGTAQVARPAAEGGGYAPGKYTVVFAGFAPVKDPRIVGVIVVHEPGIRSAYGGYVCGPVFREVVRDSLIAMNVAADPHIDNPDRVAGSLVEGDFFLADLSLEPILPPMDDVYSDDDPFDGPPSPPLPNFEGMTKHDAAVKLAELGVRWDFQGAGWVVGQDPAPGTPLRAVSLCRLRFAPKGVVPDLPAPDEAAHESS